jgi:signal transduction histidine kinase
MPTLIASIAIVVALWAVVRTPRRRRSEPRDWLPAALRSLSHAEDSRTLAAELSRSLESGIDAAHVEWWQRDEDGAYRSRSGRIGGSDAGALDAWVGSGGTWRREDTTDADAPRVLAATGTALIVARPVGFLAVGARRDQRPYAEAEVDRLEALADHLVLVTERARMASQLDESRRMLQQATRLSTVGTLAAELAHEIRNPLVAVQTFLQILPERLDDPEVTVDLRGVALTELQRVARLLNELLGMARASVATFATTDLEIVVEQVVRFLQVSARKKEIVLDRVGEPLPSGTADASRLKQALVNLVLNAIQASPPGRTVTVATHTVVDGGGRPVVEIAIRDEGPGIPDEEREAVFHPFFTTKDSGTGLGLPVTRQIISDHGGSVTVESGVGCGATFVIRLPLATPSAERQDTACAVRAA